MPHYRFMQRIVVIAAATWITGMAQAAPATVPFSASVTVLQQIEIKEDFNLNFGKIDKPRTGTQDFTVNFDGSTMVTGSGGGSFIGGHQAGQYDFLGSADQAVDINVTRKGGCSNNTLRLDGLSIDVAVPPILPMNDVKVKGTLRVSAVTPPGQHTCPYAITAQYE